MIENEHPNPTAVVIKWPAESARRSSCVNLRRITGYMLCAGVVLFSSFVFVHTNYYKYDRYVINRSNSITRIYVGYNSRHVLSQHLHVAPNQPNKPPDIVIPGNSHTDDDSEDKELTK